MSGGIDVTRHSGEVSMPMSRVRADAYSLRYEGFSGNAERMDSGVVMLREIIELGVHNFQDFEREFPGIHEHLDQCCDQLTKVGFYLNDHLTTHTDFPAFGSMLLTVHRTLVGAAVRFVTKD